MFEKLKQIRQLKKLGDSLSKEKTEIEKKGIKVVVNGKIEVEKIQLNPELDIKEQERILEECINEAIKKVQMEVFQKISQISKFGF